MAYQIDDGLCFGYMRRKCSIKREQRSVGMEKALEIPNE